MFLKTGLIEPKRGEQGGGIVIEARSIIARKHAERIDRPGWEKYSTEMKKMLIFRRALIGDAGATTRFNVVEFQR